MEGANASILRYTLLIWANYKNLSFYWLETFWIMTCKSQSILSNQSKCLRFYVFQSKVVFCLQNDVFQVLCKFYGGKNYIAIPFSFGVSWANFQLFSQPRPQGSFTWLFDIARRLWKETLVAADKNHQKYWWFW